MMNKKYILLLGIAYMFTITISIGQITMNKKLQMTGATTADRTITGATNIYLYGKITIDGLTFVDNKNAANILIGDTKNAVLTGNNNILIGTEAGRFAANSSSTIFIGYRAGYGNTNYDGVIGIGYQAAIRNQAIYTTAVGYEAGYNNTFGLRNVYLGKQAGYANETHNDNVYFGYLSGYRMIAPTTGGEVVALGTSSALKETSKSTFIGYGSDAPTNGLTQIIGIGAYSYPAANNVLLIGNATATTLAVGINIDKPRCMLDINATGSMLVPVGTTMERPSAQKGMIRYNTTTQTMEVYNGATWKKFNY